MRALNGPNNSEGSPLVGERVLFVGSCLAFPEVMLRLVQMEFEGLGATRIDSLDPEYLPESIGAPALVIVEDRLAGMLDLHFAAIRRRFGATPIALAYGDPAPARRLLALQQRERRLEVLRFLPLNASVAGLVSMLRLLLAGEFVVPGDLICPTPPTAPEPTPQPARARPPQPAPDTTLTHREREVLDRVAQGDRNKIIADALGVSEHTVKLHIHHIIAKIGVNNRTAAAKWYLARRGADGAPQPAS